jgi:surface protein
MSLPGGEFIFDISTISWTTSKETVSKYRKTSTNTLPIPILNKNKSFKDLSWNAVDADGLTTVKVTWTSYDLTDLDLSNTDGLHFVISDSSEVANHTKLGSVNYMVPYFNNPSVNITKFGGIPLSRNTKVFKYSNPKPNTEYTFGIFQIFNGRITATDTPTIQGNTNFSNIFRGSTSSELNISNWDVSGVTNMSSAFEDCTKFNGNLENWNVVNVTSMTKMFSDCLAFTSDISLEGNPGSLSNPPENILFSKVINLITIMLMRFIIYK